MSHVAPGRSLTGVIGTIHPKERTMAIIEIYRVRIDPASVPRVLEIHEAAVAEYQEQVPELLAAELVRLDDDVWLDILRWNGPVEPARIDAAAACTPTAAEFHALLADELGHDRGELVHSTGTTWAAAR
jgi:hypothetical protein